MMKKNSVAENYMTAKPSPVQYLDMLREMLHIRMVEEAIARVYPEQEIRCPTHLCIGQEAIPAGISAHLSHSDFAYSAHRSHGHYLAKGGSLKSMMAEFYGKATGCSGGLGGSQHLIDVESGFMGSVPILSSTIAIGVGAAWGAQVKNLDRVVVIYFGDGAIEEGSFHEALNFAGVNGVPAVFVCENNLYSVHSPMSVRQPEGRSIWEFGRVYGMEGLVGDGNNITEVWQLGGHAVDKARRGEGPTLLELNTYRWMEHCGSKDDSDLGFRSEEALLNWKKLCPVVSCKKELIDGGLLTESAYTKMVNEIENEIEEAITFAKSSPFPSADELGRYLYPAKE